MRRRRRLARSLFTALAALSLVLLLGLCVLWVRRGDRWTFDGDRRHAISFTRRGILFERHTLTHAPYPGPAPGTFPGFAPAPGEVRRPYTTFPRWEHTAGPVGMWQPNWTRNGVGRTTHTSWTKAADAVTGRPVHVIQRVEVYAVAYWPPAIVLAVLPATWFVTARLLPRLRETKRHRQGRCLACGYDLRVQLALSARGESKGDASPARCPECGSPAPASVATI